MKMKGKVTNVLFKMKSQPKEAKQSWGKVRKRMKKKKKKEKK